MPLPVHHGSRSSYELQTIHFVIETAEVLWKPYYVLRGHSVVTEATKTHIVICHHVPPQRVKVKG